MKTATRLVTINRSDWSGKTETIAVDHATMTFALMGYRFRLEAIDVAPEDEELIGRGYQIRSADGSWSSDCDLGSVWVRNERASAHQLDIERDDACPLVAAAKLLCNTI
jgi:hypothetical protein